MPLTMEIAETIVMPKVGDNTLGVRGMVTFIYLYGHDLDSTWFTPSLVWT